MTTPRKSIGKVIANFSLAYLAGRAVRQHSLDHPTHSVRTPSRKPPCRKVFTARLSLLSYCEHGAIGAKIGRLVLQKSCGFPLWRPVRVPVLVPVCRASYQRTPPELSAPSSQGEHTSEGTPSRWKSSKQRLSTRSLKGQTSAIDGKREGLDLSLEPMVAAFRIGALN